jgi:HPt (histidine-containing phosphotransfer) domain-containing protein
MWEEAMANPALALLRRVGGQALVVEMVELFLLDLPTRLGRVREALEGGDPGAVAAAAHSLRSSCGNLGAEQSRAACERIELAAVQAQLDLVPELLTELETAVLAEGEALRAELSSAAVA